MKVALAGAGAFGVKHLEAMAKIDGVQGGLARRAHARRRRRRSPRRFGIGHVTTELDESLARPDRRRGDPGHAHADARQPDDRLPQGGQARAGRDPARRSPGRRRRGRARAEGIGQGRDGRPHAALQSRATSGCTRRSSPARSRSSRWTCRPISSAARTSTRWGRRARWTDHLLWHHAAHTVDLFAYQTGGRIVAANAVQGPIHPELGIAHGHVDPAEEQHRARSARCRCPSTTTARSARSSATSATTAPTSRATTISSTARKRRSTCRRSMSP